MKPKRTKSHIDQHPLAGLDRQTHEFARIAENVFEEECVKYLLGRFDMASVRFELLRKHKLATGENRLTLHDFCLHYDSFPLAMDALVTKVSRSDRLSALYKDFGQRPVMKKWRELRSELPQELKGRPFALVVKWPYMSRGLVFHTLGDLGINGVRLHWRERRFELYVEPFEQVVAWLKTNWSPE